MVLPQTLPVVLKQVLVDMTKLLHQGTMSSRGSVVRLALLLLGSVEAETIGADMIPASLVLPEVPLHGQEIVNAEATIAETRITAGRMAMVLPQDLRHGNSKPLPILLLVLLLADTLDTLLLVMVPATKDLWARHLAFLHLQD